MVSGRLQVLAALPQEKNPFISIELETVRTQSQFSFFGERKNLVPLPGIPVI
jgi:hypothetical protein